MGAGGRVGGTADDRFIGIRGAQRRRIGGGTGQPVPPPVGSVGAQRGVVLAGQSPSHPPLHRGPDRFVGPIGVEIEECPEIDHLAHRLRRAGHVSGLDQRPHPRRRRSGAKSRVGSGMSHRHHPAEERIRLVVTSGPWTASPAAPSDRIPHSAGRVRARSCWPRSTRSAARPSDRPDRCIIALCQQHRQRRAGKQPASPLRSAWLPLAVTSISASSAALSVAVPPRRQNLDIPPHR